MRVASKDSNLVDYSELYLAGQWVDMTVDPKVSMSADPKVSMSVDLMDMK